MSTAIEEGTTERNERRSPKITIADLKPFDQMPEYHLLKSAGGGGVLKFDPPDFYGDIESLDTFSSSVIKAVEVEQPKLEINEIYEATPLPASNIILHEDTAGHHRYFDVERDVCMFERFGNLLVDPEDKRIAFKSRFYPARMSKALSLHGQVPGNYAHFLTEILPKLVVADENEAFTDYPMLVDHGWTHPNLQKLLQLFNRHSRKMIRVGREQPANVHHLIDISPTAYAPPEYRWFLEGREMEITGQEVYRFSQEAINLVRNYKLRREMPSSAHGARLFLGRKVTEMSTGRELVNMHHLAHAASAYGFEAITTGEMSVPEQIATFREARVVISPIGASLSNLIFTPPGCDVICLSPIYDKANYHYFASLMSVLGHKLTYVVGPQIDGTSPHPFHKNYIIDPDDFNQQLARVGKPKKPSRSIWNRRL